MIDACLSLAQRFGPWVALCGALLWYLFWLSRHTIERAQANESALLRRLDVLESEYRDDLRACLRQATSALERNSDAFQAAAAALRELSLSLHHTSRLHPDTLNRLRRATASANPHD